MVTIGNGQMVKAASAVVVGAMGALVANATAGEVPVVHEAQKLLASDGMPSDKFGIAIDREGDTLIIGAPQHYTNSLPGSFYVFTRDQTGHWSEQTRIMSGFKAGSAEFGDLFGEELAMEGDTLLVGAPFVELDGVMRRGSVYVFARDAGGAWIAQQTLPPVDENVLHFGERIALAGNIAVIGSTDRAFVFQRDGAGVWSLQSELLGLELDFVSSVAFDGQRIVVAVGAFSQGAHRAHVFRSDGSGWTLESTIIPPPALFGRIADVCLDGDRLALGLPDAAGEDLAFVFQHTPPDAWAQQAMLNPNTLDNDSFGSDVALRDDVLLVGANHAGANGITYLYRRSAAGTWSEALQLMSSDNFPENFGDEIHFEDRLPVIGSWAHHENGLYSGAAYVFDEIPTPVLGDITGDGVVNIDDLLAVIAAWGPCPAPPATCPADVTLDGVVNIDDLLMVISNWG